MADAIIWSDDDIWIARYNEDFVELGRKIAFCGPDMLQKHRVGVDKSGRATYCFDFPCSEEGCELGDTREMRSYADLAYFEGFELESAKKEWPKSTIDGLSKALSEACNLVGVPVPEKLLAALANATELVVTFHNFDGDFQILEAGNEEKMADGSDKDDEDEDE